MFQLTEVLGGKWHVLPLELMSRVGSEDARGIRHVCEQPLTFMPEVAE